MSMGVLVSLRAVVGQNRLGQFLLKQAVYCSHSHMSTVRLTEDSTTSVAEAESRTESLGPTNARLLRVSIIGMPNAGKSTLVNQLLAFDVCPVSKRVHTTRKVQQAIYLKDNTQVVFTDTPGVVNANEAKKFSFSKDFVQGPINAIKRSDLVAVVQDVSNPIFRHKLDHRIITVLKECRDKSAILILNKVDTLKTKRLLLETIRHLTKSTVGGVQIPVVAPKVTSHKPLDSSLILNKAKAKRESRLAARNLAKYGAQPVVATTNESPADLELDSTDDDGSAVHGWAHFQDVFMISALQGDGVEHLLDYFVANAIPAQWDFNEDVLTDCAPTELALRIIKAKMLEHLPQEIPYKVTPVLEYWDEADAGGLKVIIRIDCPSERLAKIVIGQAGSNIQLISLEAEKSLTKVLQQSVDLHLNVKCTALPKTDGPKQ